MCTGRISCLYTHALSLSVWVVKDSDSLQAVLDKEWTTKAIVETIFSPPLSPLELCGQASSGRGDEDQFPCRATSSAVFLMPTYCIEEEEENETDQEKALLDYCCITQLLIKLLPNQILVCTKETRSIVGLINAVWGDQLQSN